MPAALLVAALSVCAPPPEDTWPCYRGPTGDGHAGKRGLPLVWGEQQNVRWKTAIHGKGWSSPVVWGEQVWLTTADEVDSGRPAGPAPNKPGQRGTVDRVTFFAVCVDRKSGAVVHDVKLAVEDNPAYCIPFNSYASPTPAVEEGRVYAHFGSHGTWCLDTATGKVVWERRDLKCDHFRGPGSSPIVHGDLLYLTFDGFDAQYVAALDKKTGRTVWKTDRKLPYPTDNGDYKKAYSTPAIIKVGDREQLISPAAHATQAFDPLTGQELWRVVHGGMNAAARPIFGHGRLYLTNGDIGTHLLAVRPDGKGDVTATHVDWKFNKGAPSRASLLLVGDLLFMANNNGVAICLDAKTGQEVQRVRLGTDMVASPICADGHLYFFDQEGGKGFVLEATREMKLLATNKLEAGCMASPAVAGKALYVRTRTHLYRIEAP
jgi:outer membrane protein assembly factor BamB